MFVHGDNLVQKEQHKRKYNDEESRELLAEIRAMYNVWHTANLQLNGPGITQAENEFDTIVKRTALVEDYKRFLDQQIYAEKFDSRSNLHSSVLEEFLYYLFRDLVSEFGNRAFVGKSHTFKDLFFVPPNYAALITRPHAAIERKDHDFIIGATVEMSLQVRTQSRNLREQMEAGLENENAADDTMVVEDQQTQRAKAIAADPHNPAPVEQKTFDIPAVVVECKTYLDKTMLEGSSRAAEDLKARNPNSIYIVVMEWIKLTEDVNLRKYKVDQIYVLRKQKNTDREYRLLPGYVKNHIDPEVVFHLFQMVRRHLTSDWKGGVQHGLERGWLI